MPKIEGDDADYGAGLLMVLLLGVALFVTSCDALRKWDLCRKALEANNDAVAKDVCR